MPCPVCPVPCSPAFSGSDPVLALLLQRTFCPLLRVWSGLLLPLAPHGQRWTRNFSVGFIWSVFGSKERIPSGYWIKFFMCPLVPIPNSWNRMRNDKYPALVSTSVWMGNTYITQALCYRKRELLCSLSAHITMLIQVTLQHHFSERASRSWRVNSLYWQIWFRIFSRQR